MTEQTAKLWKDSAFIEDVWRHAETDDGEGHVIIPLAAWLGLSADQRKAGSNRLGVLLAPGDRLNVIVADLASLPLVALSFPVYNDGRSHSKAATNSPAKSERSGMCWSTKFHCSCATASTRWKSPTLSLCVDWKLAC
jgi:hypothetical protein